MLKVASEGPPQQTQILGKSSDFPVTTTFVFWNICGPGVAVAGDAGVAVAAFGLKSAPLQAGQLVSFMLVPSLTRLRSQKYFLQARHCKYSTAKPSGSASAAGFPPGTEDTEINLGHSGPEQVKTGIVTPLKLTRQAQGSLSKHIWRRTEKNNAGEARRGRANDMPFLREAQSSDKPGRF
jgi:hypothetical protein